MRPLKHGYTNRTVGDGSVVEKTYEGPDAGIRRAREYALLTRLQGKLPVPPVRGVDDRVLTLGFVAGTPGQGRTPLRRLPHPSRSWCSRACITLRLTKDGAELLADTLNHRPPPSH